MSYKMQYLYVSFRLPNSFFSLFVLQCYCYLLAISPGQFLIESRMNEAISNYVSNSILQATAEHVSSTTQRTAELAAYLRLNSVSEHAGGLFSGGIELHVPSTISNIRIGCDSIPTDHSTLVVSDAWIDVTGVYRSALNLLHYPVYPRGKFRY